MSCGRTQTPLAVQPGIHTMSAAVYHADPCEQPSLSSSIAKLLCEGSAAHARMAHPRLNPAFERVEEEKFDLGTVAHALLLEGESGVQVVNADDWRTKAAKEARAMARLEGRTPLLQKHWDQVQAMVASTRAQFDAHEARPVPFTDGKPEQVLIWEDDGGVLCRARVDWLRDDLAAIDDFKSTGRSAEPDAWTRQTLYGIGADIQVAFYLRGLERLTGKTDVAWRFVVQETFPPYALAVVSLGPDVMQLARKKVEYALAKWRLCFANEEWPAYPSEICWAVLPPWEERRWLDKETREFEAAHASSPMQRRAA